MYSPPSCWRGQLPECQYPTLCSVLLTYAPRVFSHVGITSERAVLGATVLLGAAKTVAIVVPLFLANSLGRRPMLLTSAGGMAASLLVLGLSIRATSAATCVAAAVAFMATFSLGFGPVIWMYGSEILPLRLRAQGTGVRTAVNRVMSAIMGMAFIPMYETFYAGLHLRGDFRGVGVRLRVPA
jgi:MFS family permease